MKKLIISCVALIMAACSQTNKTVENQIEKYAIDSIAFLIPEQSFDSVKNVFEAKVSNPERNDENLESTYPFVYKGWEFDKVTGIFSKDGLLVGVKLSNMQIQSREWNSAEQLDSLVAAEFGKPTDARQAPSENDVKAQGEYAYKFFQNGNRCALVTFSFSNDHLHENLYVYRADQITQSGKGRHIDNDLEQLTKLK